MAGLDASILSISAFAAVSAGALAYAVLGGRIAAEQSLEKRKQLVKRSDSERATAKSTRDRVSETAKRRKSVQETVKELEQRQKVKDRALRRPPLRIQLRQAGMQTSVEGFYIYSAISGLIVAAAIVVVGAPLVVLPAGALAGAVGLPRWFVAFKRNRRMTRFLEEFPNALDIVVRAIRSGLPLHDGIRLIASESPEPVRGEFRRIVEAQQIGLSIPDAASRMQETMPCPEAGFFGVVIQIQNQAGGNISEALDNLSRVLRDRKRMKAKIKALSMEVKVSAVIIGALPFVVATLVMMLNPGYILPLFLTSTGNVILAGAGIWMAIGLLVMRQMMNLKV